MTSKISASQLSITTKNTVYLDGQFTEWHVRQTRERTTIWRNETPGINSPIVELTLPKTQYSTSADKPACGAGRVEFYNDIKAAIAKEKASA